VPKRSSWAVTSLIALVACGSHGVTTTSVSPPTSSNAETIPPPGLPAEVLPGYVIRDSTVDAALLSADALDPGSLQALLTGAGFEVGSERRFTARGKRLTEVVARVLRFRSARGATVYLTWLGAHGVDLLGSRTQPAEPPDLPGAVAFSHGVSGCCTKDTYQYFLAWTRGPYTATLLVGGPAAGPGSALPFANDLDARIRKEA